MPRCPTLARLTLACLLLPAVPAVADDIRHGPVTYGTTGEHQHGPVHYGNGPDHPQTPGRYRTHSYRPHLRDGAPPVIIVEPRIELDRQERLRFPHHRRPERRSSGPRRSERLPRGDAHWFIEDHRAFSPAPARP